MSIMLTIVDVSNKEMIVYGNKDLQFIWIAAL